MAEAAERVDPIETMFDPSDTAPEAPAEEVSEGEDTETPDAPPSGRDAQGRFTATPEAEDSPAPSDEEAPDDAPPETSPEPDDAAEAEETPDDLSAYPVFTYRGGNQDHAFPGTHVGEDGVLFTNDALPHLQQKLAAAEAYPQLQSRYARDVQTAKDETAALRAQLDVFTRKFEELVSNPDSEATIAWLQNQHVNLPVLKAEAKAKALELEREAERGRLTQYEQERQDQQLLPEMQTALAQTIVRVGAGLPQAMQEKLYQRLSQPEELYRLFPRAEQDDPAHGITKGQRHGLLVEGQVQREVQFLRGLGTLVNPTVQQAAKRNAAQREKTQQPPPVAGGTRGATPKGKTAVPDFSKAENPTQAADDFLWGQGGFKTL